MHKRFLLSPYVRSSFFRMYFKHSERKKGQKIYWKIKKSQQGRWTLRGIKTDKYWGCFKTGGFSLYLIRRAEKTVILKNILNSLELSVMVLGLFGSISASASMQIRCEWSDLLGTSGRLSMCGTTITTSPLPWTQSLSRWLTYWVGIELLFCLIEVGWRLEEKIGQKRQG